MDGRSLADHPKRWLERNFPMEDVKVAVFSLKEDKARGIMASLWPSIMIVVIY